MSTNNAITKPGKHGTLFLYVIEYRDPIDSGFPVSSTRLWGYNAEHVCERFHDGDEGFAIVSVKRAVRS